MAQNIAQFLIFPFLGGFAGLAIAVYSEDEKLRFTTRGFVVVFLLGAIVGGGLYSVVSHLFWVCGSTTCGYKWVTF